MMKTRSPHQSTNRFRRLRSKQVYRPQLEFLEDRITPTATLVSQSFVNDDWHFVTDTDGSGTLSIGDEIRNDNDTVNTGNVTAFYGLNGFGTVTTGAHTGTVAGHVTIPDAIVHTSAGGTVDVLDGTYSGLIVIDKALNLRGSNADIHPTVGNSSTETVGTRVAESIISHNGLFAINPQADNITINGFTFESNSGSRTIDSSGENYDNLHITNNIFDTKDTAGFTGVIQIVAGNHDAITIDFNSFINTGAGGSIHTGGAAGTGSFTNMRIANNLFDGEATGVQWFTAIPMVDGVIVENEFSSGGAGLNIGRATDITIADNHFHDMGSTGFQVGMIGGNILRNRFERIDSPALELWGNEFETFVSTNVTIANNFISYNDVTGSGTHGIRLRPPATGSGIDASTIHITNNSLVNGGVQTGVFAVRHEGDQTTAADASGNWWGTTDENAILTLMQGPVDFTPFLNDGTDTDSDPTNGFQGDFSTVVVTSLGAQTGATARIQEGINRVDAGDIVQIRTGTYSGNVDATATGTNKAVTLAPGAGPGQVTIDGDLTLDANDTLEFELNGTIAGTQYDQFRIIGTNRTVTLGNAELDVVLNFSPAQGNSFVLIDNVDLSSTVSGVFNHNGTPLNEGNTFTINGQIFRISYQGGDGNDVVLTTVTGPQEFFVVGADAGASPTVQVYDTATRELITSFLAYGAGFTGGVHVALGDVNGDLVPDIITGPGPGGGPHVKVFDGQTFAEIRSFMAYDNGFRGGVFVAAGDINGDGFADIITGAGPGGGPHVKVFDGNTGVALRSFFAYDAGFRGGVSVGAGDFNGDLNADIVTGAGPGGGPHVKVFDGNTTAEIASFFAYTASFNGGIFVAANDFNGDGQVDLITGAGAGGGPHVKVFDGDNLNNTLASFLAYDATMNDGVRVASQFINADARAELITGRGGLSQVKLFDAATLNEIDSFFAFTNNVGVFVG